MKKFTYDVIKQPNLSNRLELKTHVLVENHIDDVICLHIIASNKLLDMVILNPFQKKTIFIPCYFEEDIVKVKDDDKVEWNLLEFQKFRAFLV